MNASTGKGRCVLSLLVSILLMSFVLTAQAVERPEGLMHREVVVNSEDGLGLNLRSGPGTNHDKVLNSPIPQGTVLWVTARQYSTYGNPWVYTRYGNSYGWIYEPETYDNAQYTEDVYYGNTDVYVNAGDVYLREGPGTEYGKVQSKAIPRNTHLSITASTTSIHGNTWGFTSYNGSSGWVYLDDMTTNAQKASSPGATQTWYDAYRDFVENERYMNFTGPSFDEDGPYVDPVLYESYGNQLEHSLYDINRDGVPELIVYQEGWTIGGCNSNIFSYQNGQIVYLGAVNGPTITYDPSEKYPGLFIALHHSYGEATYITMQNGRIKKEIIVEYDFGNDHVLTSDNNLYKTWLSLESKAEQGLVLESTSFDEIKGKGWDAFVAKYGFSKPVPFAGFYDVQESDWFAEPVLWAVENGITNGTSSNQFSPGQTCTTAQILTFLWRAAGSPEPNISNPFTNVKSSDYFYKAAVWAAEKGLVSGSKFNGSTPCTRSDTVTYLWKLSGSPSAGTSAFSDVSASAPYSQAVAWAVSKGVTSGTGNNKFSPNDTCTRGQIVTFLYRWTQL